MISTACPSGRTRQLIAEKTHERDLQRNISLFDPKERKTEIRGQKIEFAWTSGRISNSNCV